MNESSMCIDLQVLNYEEIYWKGHRCMRYYLYNTEAEHRAGMKMLASNVILCLKWGLKSMEHMIDDTSQGKWS